MYTRTKKVTLDGAEFLIAPLTVNQVEDQINKRQTPTGELDAAAVQQMTNYVYELVATGLNNAASANGAQADWTVDNLPERLDSVTIEFLQGEIIVFSGMEYQKGGQQGESSAAAPTAV